MRICIVLVPNNTHICTQWPQNFFNYFFGDEYSKNAEFHADFKSVEIIEKVHPEKVNCQKLLQISSIEEENPQFLQ